MYIFIISGLVNKNCERVMSICCVCKCIRVVGVGVDYVRL